VEWTREHHRVEAGQAFLLLPGAWHRYRPDTATGWTEDWFELRGEMVERWIKSGLVRGRLFTIEQVDSFFAAMDELHRECLRPSRAVVGRQAGRALGLLADLLDQPASGAAPKLRPGQRELVAEARARLCEGVGVRDVAEILGVSYPTLNRVFKQSTGIGPKAYSAQMRMARAEALLGAEQLSIKEIAAELGFHSGNHFSAAFKTVYGVAPSFWIGQQAEYSCRFAGNE